MGCIVAQVNYKKNSLCLNENERYFLTRYWWQKNIKNYLHVKVLHINEILKLFT
jgi:hypothetical protein